MLFFGVFGEKEILRVFEDVGTSSVLER